MNAVFTVPLIFFSLHVKLQIVENYGAESIELERYKAKLDERARQEEELFTRAPITKEEKRKAKHLLKSRNGYTPFSY